MKFLPVKISLKIYTLFSHFNPLQIEFSAVSKLLFVLIGIEPINRFTENIVSLYRIRTK